MAEPFLGEIRIFAGTFAPTSWAFCDGQLLSIGQNPALFTLLGTLYGGDGRTTFGLPDLRGRVPIHMGQGPGLTNRTMGLKSGSEAVVVTQNQLASHSHDFHGLSGAAEDMNPAMNLPATPTGSNLYGSATPARPLDAAAIEATGQASASPHANVMPFLCLNFIIALFGNFP
jgi:microcystin-dependent protein